jgi:hypothetical protein
MVRKNKATTHMKQPGQQESDPKKKLQEEEVDSTIETTTGTASRTTKTGAKEEAKPQKAVSYL